MTVPRQPDKDFFLFPFLRRRVRLLDGAYACYAFLGLAMMAFMAVSTVTVSTIIERDYEEGSGMLVASILSLMLPLPIVFVAAIVLTVRFRRHRALVVLCLTNILFFAAIAIGIPDCCSEGASERAINAIGWICGAVVTLVPAWWFTMGRRRKGDKSPLSTRRIP